MTTAGSAAEVNRAFFEAEISDGGAQVEQTLGRATSGLGAGAGFWTGTGPRVSLFNAGAVRSKMKLVPPAGAPFKIEREKRTGKQKLVLTRVGTGGFREVNALE
jgi:hypothetical protein